MIFFGVISTSFLYALFCHWLFRLVPVFSLTLSAHAREGYSNHFVCLSVNNGSRRWQSFSVRKRYQLTRDPLSNACCRVATYCRRVSPPLLSQVTRLQILCVEKKL